MDEVPYSGTPITLTGVGSMIVHDDRRLTVVEWLAVRVFRRPDPRVSVYPVTFSEDGRFTATMA